MKTTTQDSAPSAQNGPLCGRCGQANEPRAQTCWSCGAFLQANTKAVIHGGRSRAMFQHPDVVAAMREERHAIAADLGGDHGTIKLNIISALVQTKTIRSSMFDLMVKHGIKGRAFDRFVAILDREARLSALLGLERRSRPVNPLDAVRAAVAEANR